MLVRLKPALKSYLWGGTKLKADWNKKSDAETVAEAWELSFHPDGPAVIDGGKFDGELLRTVATPAMWGKNCKQFSFFPVLSKLIDAAQPLSIQVHPSDEYALAHEGQYGKTEMWHILDAEEGAFLYLGFKRDTTPEEFADAIKNNTVCDFLNRVPVKAGDTYFIPSGTIHAIGAGITLFEIQQNSSLTYRVYDYDRRDAAGNLRELHVEKAMKVIDWKKYEACDCARGDLLGECKYFSVTRGTGERTLGREDSFVSATVTGGCAEIGGLQVKKGETVFLSAGEFARVEGSAEYIIISVNAQE